MGKVYFPNLNGIRFFAAFLVIIHHIEQLKSFFGIANYWATVPFIAVIGKLGVVLFFVLSGFLITYLLVVEEYSFRTISIKNFYIRRMLRIWPLYFLIIFLAFAVLPHIDLFAFPGYSKERVYVDWGIKILLYTIFFPNLVLAVLGIVPYASHTWSIGTEEQFYLAWPVILKYFRRYRIFLMVMIIALYLGFAGLLATSYLDFIPYIDVIRAFWKTFNIDCMAIGGIYAVLLFKKHNILKLLLNTYLFYSILILVILLLITGVKFPYLNYEIYSVFFGMIILNFAANDKIKISLENRLLHYLGTISYGLYMYHPIAIVLVLAVAKSINYTSNWLIYPTSCILTVGLAAISYKYFESFFLRFKNTFASVLSGNLIKVK